MYWAIHYFTDLYRSLRIGAVANGLEDHDDNTSCINFASPSRCSVQENSRWIPFWDLTQIHQALETVRIPAALSNAFFRSLHKIAKSNCYLRHFCLYVCPSFRVEKLGSNWTDFHEIWYLTSRKCVQKVRVLLKCEDNSRKFTRTPTNTYDNISLHSS